MFNNIDIIVWNGIITRFGVIKEIMVDGDCIRLANIDEFVIYHEQQTEN